MKELTKKQKENLEDYLNWMVRFPEQAMKQNPEFVTGIEERINQWSPYRNANIILSIPKSFDKWKRKSNRLHGITKVKYIEEQIELITLVLNSPIEDEIEAMAVVEVKDELEEQLQYWKHRLLFYNNGIEITKEERLFDGLDRFGFFELEKVKSLSNASKTSLVQLLLSYKKGQVVCMFDHLGFLKHLMKCHFNSTTKMSDEINKWFNPNAKDGTEIRKNINSLNPKSETKRYHALDFKEKVINDYNNLE